MTHSAVAAIQVASRRWVVADVRAGVPQTHDPKWEFRTAERACRAAATEALWCDVDFVVVPMPGQPYTPAVLDLAAARAKAEGRT